MNYRSSMFTFMAYILIGGIAMDCARANKIGYSLPALIEASDEIFTAEVISINQDAVIDTKAYQLKVATVDLRTCFKKVLGTLNQKGRQTKILFLTGGIEEPDLEAGRTYYFFIQNDEGGPHPVGGLPGVVPVQGDKARTISISSEPKTQNTAALDRRISQLTRNLGCDL